MKLNSKAHVLKIAKIITEKSQLYCVPKHLNKYASPGVVLGHIWWVMGFKKNPVILVRIEVSCFYIFSVIGVDEVDGIDGVDGLDGVNWGR